MNVRTLQNSQIYLSLYEKGRDSGSHNEAWPDYMARIVCKTFFKVVFQAEVRFSKI